VKIADLIEEDDAELHPGYFNSPCIG